MESALLAAGALGLSGADTAAVLGGLAASSGGVDHIGGFGDKVMSLQSCSFLGVGELRSEDSEIWRL